MYCVSGDDGRKILSLVGLFVCRWATKQPLRNSRAYLEGVQTFRFTRIVNRKFHGIGTCYMLIHVGLVILIVGSVAAHGGPVPQVVHTQRSNDDWQLLLDPDSSGGKSKEGGAVAYGGRTDSVGTSTDR